MLSTIVQLWISPAALTYTPPPSVVPPRVDYELTKLGASVETRVDGLTVHPPRHIQPAVIDTYDDHRMAMSFAVAGLRADGITINDPDCCEKTFPGFFAAFEKATIPDR